MDPTAGITCSDLRRVVREALHNGWQWGGMTGTTHARIVWPPTGEAITFGMTPGVASWKTTATLIQRASGVEVWRKGNRKRSRKAFKASGFTVDAARRETRQWHDRYGAEVERLRERHAALCEELDAAVSSGKRSDAGRFRVLYAEVREVEETLTGFHVPVSPYMPGVTHARS